MSQLKLAYVNCSIVQRRPNKSAMPTRASSTTLPTLSLASLPSFAVKAARLHQIKPHAAAVIERLVDDLLVEAEGRKL